jgi:hypothetical protein
MKNRITFLVITSRTGVQRRFSISKNILFCIIILLIFLLSSGIIGAWKYWENVSLKKEFILLKAEKRKIEAVTRTVKDIQREEKDIKQILGLENVDEKNETP